MASLSLVEAAKKAAAHQAVDSHIKSDMVVGIGSGSTVVYAVEHLTAKVRKGELSNIKCVPTSFQASQLILAGLPDLILTNLNAHPQVDVTIDGADEVDPQFNLIKGGGGCMFQEKLVAFNSGTLVIIADYRKKSSGLGTVWKKGVPVEVSPLAFTSVASHIRTLTHGNPVLRMSSEKCGPVVTDNGNFILDVVYPAELLESSRLSALNTQLLSLPGVIETGLFVQLASFVLFGEEDGSVSFPIKKD